MQSCQVTPCLQELWAPVSPSLCSQEPRTGEGGAAPTSLCSWWWTRGAPCCLWGCWRPELGPAEGDEEAPMGDLQREHAGTAAPVLLHTVAPQCPQPPCKCKSCRSSQPSNHGGIWGQDLCPGETCSGHPPLICMDCDHPLDMDLSHGSTFNTSAFTGVVAPGVRAQAGTQILCAVTHPPMGVPST